MTEQTVFLEKYGNFMNGKHLYICGCTQVIDPEWVYRCFTMRNETKNIIRVEYIILNSVKRRALKMDWPSYVQSFGLKA